MRKFHCERSVRSVESEAWKNKNTAHCCENPARQTENFQDDGRKKARNFLWLRLRRNHSEGLPRNTPHTRNLRVRWRKNARKGLSLLGEQTLSANFPPRYSFRVFRGDLG